MRPKQKRNLPFVRYADDCNIYVGSRRAAERVMQSVTNFVEKHLRLKVNRQKSTVSQPWRRKLLGFSFTSNKKEPKRRIAQESLEKFQRQIRQRTKRTRNQSVQQLISEGLTPYLRGWRSDFGFCQTPSVLQELDRWIRRRLRSWLWKQWENGRRGGGGEGFLNNHPAYSPPETFHPHPIRCKFPSLSLPLTPTHNNPMDTKPFDLIVIGGGPAGTSGANAAGFLGKRVALVEKLPHIGGAGINTGTIPSKTLRETALALSGFRSRKLFGVDLSLRRQASIADFMHHERIVTAQERDRVSSRLQQHCVERFQGQASFIDASTVQVTSPNGTPLILRGEKILIATGSRPVRPPEFNFDDDRIHDSDEILELKELPQYLVVIGAGVIGSEYACTFAALGTRVDIVDGRNTLLPFLDAEISQALLDAMTTNGIQFLWNERVKICDLSQPGKVNLTLTSGKTINSDGVLVCAGRCSNTESLNLAAAGILPGNRGLIPVNENYQTATSHIYAAGDVIGPPALAASSAEQARVAVTHAFNFGLESRMASILPTGIYTIPEVSMVGDTEETLKSKGINYLVGRARYLDNARGKIIGDETGFLKLIFHADDWKLLGIQVIGEQATELVHIGLTAMLAGADAQFLSRICFNYPTLGDLYQHAAYNALLQRLAPSCKSPQHINEDLSG